MYVMKRYIHTLLKVVITHCTIEASVDAQLNLYLLQIYIYSFIGDPMVPHTNKLLNKNTAISHGDQTITQHNNNNIIIYMIDDWSDKTPTNLV